MSKGTPRPLGLEPGQVLAAATPDGGSAYFELQRPLAEGGGGVVWEAVDDGGAPVVVKGPHVAGVRDEGLEREAELLSSLPPHPCVVRLLGTVRDPRGHRLLVIERLHPHPLEALSAPELRAQLDEKTRGRHAAIPPALALELCYELARGVEHLHAHRLVHCDLKPPNLMLALDGLEADPGGGSYLDRLARGTWRGVLIDLGGARRNHELDPGPGRPQGPPPQLTPLYAPPEVLPGQWDEALGRERSRYTPWIDSYAFGLVLYQTLTGRAPYDHLPERPGGSLEAIVQVKRDERDGAHRPVSRAVLETIDWGDASIEGTQQQLTDELWTLLERATHHEPSKRASARQLREALGALLRVTPRPAGDASPGRDWTQRRVVPDPFAGRLARLARGTGAPPPDLKRELRRGGADFWEREGYRPPSSSGPIPKPDPPRTATPGPSSGASPRPAPAKGGPSSGATARPGPAPATPGPSSGATARPAPATPGPTPGPGSGAQTKPGSASGATPRPPRPPLQ